MMAIKCSSLGPISCQTSAIRTKERLTTTTKATIISTKEVGILCHTDIFYMVTSLCTVQAHLQSCEIKKKGRELTQSNKLSPIHLLGFGSCQADLFQRQNLPRRPEGEKATSATSTLQKTDISWAFLIEQTLSTFREQ